MIPAHEPDRPEDLELLTRLEQILPRVSPPADLFDRILDEVRAEATVVPLRAGRRRRVVAWAGATAAAAAAAVALAVGLTRDGGLGQPDARAVISSPTDASVRGEAELYDDAGKVRVSLRAVPTAPSGHHYEVWVLPQGGDAMISVGTFHGDGHDVELELELPGTGGGVRYAAVDVSVEEDAGPAAHGDTSYGSGAFA